MAMGMVERMAMAGLQVATGHRKVPLQVTEHLHLQATGHLKLPPLVMVHLHLRVMGHLQVMVKFVFPIIISL